MIKRDFITSVHKLMPISLQKHGFAMDSYEKAELEHKNRQKTYDVINQQEHSR